MNALQIIALGLMSLLVLSLWSLQNHLNRAEIYVCSYDIQKWTPETGTKEIDLWCYNSSADIQFCKYCQYIGPTVIKDAWKLNGSTLQGADE
jgi:hypothetical protein